MKDMFTLFFHVGDKVEFSGTIPATNVTLARAKAVVESPDMSEDLVQVRITDVYEFGKDKFKGLWFVEARQLSRRGS